MENSPCVDDAQKRSQVYKYYTLGEKMFQDTNGQFEKVPVGICKTCGVNIRTTRGNTSGLWNHIQTHHGIKPDGKAPKRKRQTDVDESPAYKDVVKFKDVDTGELVIIDHASLDAIVTRLVALDGDTFHNLAHSIDKRNMIHSLGIGILPKSPTGIRDMVMRFVNKIRKYYKHMIHCEKDCQVKFTVATDEWTSLAHKSYLDIILFISNNRSLNLGMCRAFGSQTAHSIGRIILAKLSTFGITKQDLIAIATDGAPLMVKLATEQVIFK